MQFENLILEQEDHLATIIINRPKKLNALNRATIQELHDALQYLEADADVQVIIITGSGNKAFVAGADIRYFVEKIRSNQIPDIESFTRKGHEIFLQIENSPKLTIALLDGLSLGGGSELALACQAIVATPAGSFGFPETGIGIFPGLGGMLRTAGQIGIELAKYYAFTGIPFNAKDAADLGIVTKLVDPSEVYII